MTSALTQGYAYLATAIAEPGIVVQFYFNTCDHRWLMIGIDDEGTACRLLQGDSWQFALLRGI